MKSPQVKIIILKSIQSILIFTCFISGFIWFDRVSFPLYSEIEMEGKNFLLENEKFSIFIMGNSHAVNSYIPELLDALTDGEKFINLSTAGVGFNSLYFYLKTALQYEQKPDLILLETYSFRFDDYDQSLFSLKGNKYLESMVDIMKYIPIEDHPISFSSLFMNYNTTDFFRTINRNSNYLKNTKNIEDDKFVQSKGYNAVHLDEAVPLDSYNLAFQYGATPFDFESYEKIFESFLTLCDENNIEVILLRSPSVNLIGLEDEYSKNLAIEYNLKYINLNKEVLNDFNNPRPLFFDAYILGADVVNSHTNHIGAQYSSLKLIESLEKLDYVTINNDSFNHNWNNLKNLIQMNEDKND